VAAQAVNRGRRCICTHAIATGVSPNTTSDAVGAGVSPIDALRMATIGSAEIIGQRGVLGEIAPGRRADMVVLKANPLQNIRNTRSIETVWLDGVQACGAL